MLNLYCFAYTPIQYIELVYTLVDTNKERKKKVILSTQKYALKMIVII